MRGAIDGSDRRLGLSLQPLAGDPAGEQNIAPVEARCRVGETSCRECGRGSPLQVGLDSRCVMADTEEREQSQRQKKKQ